MGILDSLISSMFGGGGGGGGGALSGGSGGGGGFSLGGLLSSALPIATVGGLQYLSDENKSKREQQTLQASQTFNAAEAQKNRESDLALLKLKLAADAAAGGGGGGGSGDALKIARIQALQNAYGNAQQSSLGGGELVSGALAQMVKAIQAGLAGARG